MKAASKKLGVLTSLVVVLLSVALIIAPADAASGGAKCKKVGATAVTKGFTYICKKSGKTLKWVGKTAATTTTTTTTTTATTTTATTTTTSRRPGGDGTSVALAKAATISQAEEYLRSFFAKYQMTVAITNIQPSENARMWATWAPIDENDLPALKAYGAALVDEWAKYPLEWVRVTRVSGIVLVNQLTVANATYGSTRRSAMPDHGGKVMFYDIGPWSDEYARHVIHHEFNHLLTYNLTGDYAPSDPTWLSLNPPGFQYGKGGASCYVPGNSCLTGHHPIPGFVIGYATSAIEEDKAELYGYLMGTSYYLLLKDWIRTDSYLAAKVDNYKNFLCNLSVAMCGDYFDSINTG